MKINAIVSIFAASLLLAGCSDDPGNEQIGAAPETSQGAKTSPEAAVPEEMPTPSAVATIPSNVDIPSTLVEVEDATDAAKPSQN